MAEYIEKEKALNLNFKVPAFGTKLMVARRAVQSYVDELAKIPVADVAPVRHGRWIEVGVDKDEDGIPMLIMFGCDQCHAVSWTPTPFCGYCGAKMDKEVKR